MQTVSTRFNAQRAARRALGSASAQEGVHFTTVKTADGWTWSGIPGAALDALSETVRKAAIGSRVGEDAARFNDDSRAAESAQRFDDNAIPDVVPAFMRRDFEGMADRVAAQAARQPKTEKPETGSTKRQPKVETPEATKPAKGPKKGGKVEQLRKLRESSVTIQHSPAAGGGSSTVSLPKTPARRAMEAQVAADAKAKPAAGKRAQAEADAAAGILPTPPDFTANTHKPYRAKLAALVAMVEAGDVAGLRAMTINPTSTSPKALARYRDLAVTALTAKKAGA